MSVRKHHFRKKVVSDFSEIWGLRWYYGLAAWNAKIFPLTPPVAIKFSKILWAYSPTLCRLHLHMTAYMENLWGLFAHPVTINILAENFCCQIRSVGEIGLVWGTQQPIRVCYLNSHQMSPPQTDDKGACSNFVTYGLVHSVWLPCHVRYERTSCEQSGSCGRFTTHTHTHTYTYQRYIVGKVHCGENPCILVGRCGERTHAQKQSNSIISIFTCSISQKQVTLTQTHRQLGF